MGIFSCCFPSVSRKQVAHAETPPALPKSKLGAQNGIAVRKNYPTSVRSSAAASASSVVSANPNTEPLLGLRPPVVVANNEAFFTSKFECDFFRSCRAVAQARVPLSAGAEHQGEIDRLALLKMAYHYLSDKDSPDVESNKARALEILNKAHALWNQAQGPHRIDYANTTEGLINRALQLQYILPSDHQSDDPMELLRRSYTNVGDPWLGQWILDQLSSYSISAGFILGHHNVSTAGAVAGSTYFINAARIDLKNTELYLRNTFASQPGVYYFLLGAIYSDLAKDNPELVKVAVKCHRKAVDAARVLKRECPSVSGREWDAGLASMEALKTHALEGQSFVAYHYLRRIAKEEIVPEFQQPNLELARAAYLAKSRTHASISSSGAGPATTPAFLTMLEAKLSASDAETALWLANALRDHRQPSQGSIISDAFCYYRVAIYLSYEEAMADYIGLVRELSEVQNQDSEVGLTQAEAQKLLGKNRTNLLKIFHGDPTLPLLTLAVAKIAQVEGRLEEAYEYYIHASKLKNLHATQELVQFLEEQRVPFLEILPFYRDAVLQGDQTNLLFRKLNPDEIIQEDLKQAVLHTLQELLQTLLLRASEPGNTDLAKAARTQLLTLAQSVDIYKTRFKGHTVSVVRHYILPILKRNHFAQASEKERAVALVKNQQAQYSPDEVKSRIAAHVLEAILQKTLATERFLETVASQGFVRINPAFSVKLERDGLAEIKKTILPVIYSDLSNSYDPFDELIQESAQSESSQFHSVEKLETLQATFHFRLSDQLRLMLSRRVLHLVHQVTTRFADPAFDDNPILPPCFPEMDRQKGAERLSALIESIVTNQYQEILVRSRDHNLWTQILDEHIIEELALRELCIEKTLQHVTQAPNLHFSKEEIEDLEEGIRQAHAAGASISEYNQKFEAVQKKLQTTPAAPEFVKLRRDFEKKLGPDKLLYVSRKLESQMKEGLKVDSLSFDVEIQYLQPTAEELDTLYATVVY